MTETLSALLYRMENGVAVVLKVLLIAVEIRKDVLRYLCSLQVIIFNGNKCFSVIYGFP